MSRQQVAAEHDGARREGVRCLPRHEVSTVANRKWSDMIGEHLGRVLIRSPPGSHDPTRRRESTPSCRGSAEARPDRCGRRDSNTSVPTEAGPEFGAIGKRGGVERDGVRLERAVVGPESRGVEGRDVVLALAGSVEFSRQAVRIRSLPDEVVVRARGTDVRVTITR